MRHRLEDQPVRSFGRFVATLIGLGLVGLFALIIVFGSFYTIDQSERGVILRNGAVIGVAEPGFHLKVPIFEDVVEMSLQTFVWSDTLPSYSRDQQPADLRISVTWRAQEAEITDIYANYGSLMGLQGRIIVPRATAATKTVFGSFQAATAIAERGRLNTEVFAAIRDAVAGPLIIESVQIEDIAFSDAYEASIEQRMLAEVEVQKIRQNAEREKVQADIRVTQATAEADAQRAAADAEAYTTRERAKAEAEAIKLRGTAEASAIAERGDALSNHPDLVRLVTAEKWNGQLPQTMVPDGALPMLALQGLSR
jgi:regulator of protease activity HflC (stomatin/prohibitin superfamily)